MGCDIHVKAERKTATGYAHLNLGKGPFGSVDGYIEDGCAEDTIYISRSYQLFGLLANVRCSGALLPRRGFPADAAKQTRSAFESWDGDAHTPSYWTFGELRERAGNEAIADFINQLEAGGVEFLDTDRIVFWFDN